MFEFDSKKNTNVFLFQGKGNFLSLPTLALKVFKIQKGSGVKLQADDNGNKDKEKEPLITAFREQRLLPLDRRV